MTESFNGAPRTENQTIGIDKRPGYSPSMMEAFSAGLTELVRRGIIPPQNNTDTYSQTSNTTEIRTESTVTNTYDRSTQDDERKSSAA